MPDQDIERRIATGFIVSSEFLRRVYSFWRDEFLEAPELIKISRWALSYFEKYGTAPNRHIEDIYVRELQANNLEKSEAEYIERILSRISDEYERGEQFNAQYLFDRATEYFRTREYTRHNEQVQDLIDRGELAAAEAEHRAFKPLSWVTGRGIDVGSEEGLKRLAAAFTTASKPILTYPGALGVMLNQHFIRGGFIGLMGPSKRGKCLPGNQRVLMSTGEVLPLIDVVNSERRDIVSYDEAKDKFVLAQITDFYRNGRKPVWELGTRSGRRVRVTGHHPFLTPNGWVPLRELKTGQFVAVPKSVPIFGDAELTDAQIKLLGYFIADGCLINWGTVYFSKGEEAIRRDFETCVKSMGCQVRWKGIDGAVINSDANRGLHGFNHVRKFLDDHGLMGTHSYDKRIPEIVYQLPQSKLALFLSALITCDGWVTEDDGSIGFAVANEHLARQVQELLSRYGVVSRLRFIPNDKRGAWEVGIRDYENAVRFGEQIGFMFGKREKYERIMSTRQAAGRSFLDKFPPEIAQRFYDELRDEFGVLDVERPTRWNLTWLAFSSRFTRYDAVRTQLRKDCSVMRQSFDEVRDTNAGRKYMDAAVLWDEIVRIDYVGIEETFDLTVAGHHNFVAENVLVHNTYWLLDIAMRGLRQKLNVAFFQAGDSPEDQFLRRVAIHIAGRSDQEMYCRAHWRPIGDCVFNQIDKCDRNDRNCDHGVFDTSADQYKSDRISYATFDALTKAAEGHPDYRPCDSASCTKRWPCVWLVEEPAVQPLTGNAASRAAGRFFNRYRRRFKLATYPSGTLTVDEMESCLDEWERQDDFVADIIISDYADIMDARVSDFRHKQNEIWKGLRSLSQKKRTLVVTATQADAASYRSNSLTLSNFSEDKRKFDHVTAMFGLNQSPDGRERQLGIMRINELVIREGAQVQHDVTVLQDLRKGRPFLESYSIGLRPDRNFDG